MTEIGISPVVSAYQSCKWCRGNFFLILKDSKQSKYTCFDDKLILRPISLCRSQCHPMTTVYTHFVHMYGY